MHIRLPIRVRAVSICCIFLFFIRHTPPVSSRVGSKLPLPHYADARLHIPITRRNYAGTSTASQLPEADREERIAMLGMIRDDLQWLLHLKYDKFWCQMVWDESLQALIGSYIQVAPRAHDGSSAILEDKSAVGELERDIYRLVFMTLLRSATHRESKQDFMQPETFAGIIYENWLFDIPKMLDIVAIYGGGNKTLVAKMIANIFKHQPGYHDDLLTTLEGVRGVLDLTAKRCVSGGSGGGGAKPLEAAEALELQQYAVDISATLHAFLEVCPSNAMDAFVADGTLLHLGKFYEAAIPSLTAFWGRARGRGETVAVAAGKEGLANAQLWLTLLAQQLLEDCHAREQPAPAGVETASTILDVLDQLYELETLMLDWTVRRPLAATLKLVSAQPAVDQDRIDYAIAVVDKIAADATADDVPMHGGSSSGGGDGGAGPADEGCGGGGGGGAAGGGGGPLNEAVMHIKAIFPHLGEGYIEACLDAFNNNPETVINKIFDNALPPDVKALPEDMPRRKIGGGGGSGGDSSGSSGGRDGFEPHAKAKTFKPKKDALTNRHNVFDGDEFDVSFDRPAPRFAFIFGLLHSAITPCYFYLQKKNWGGVPSWASCTLFPSPRLFTCSFYVSCAFTFLFVLEKKLHLGLLHSCIPNISDCANFLISGFLFLVTASVCIDNMLLGFLR